MMNEYKRDYPLFALCGLNCGLCPRYHTDGDSKCPGCGGRNFHLQHPACAVITCNKKHDNVEFCFQCSSYPCSRYGSPSKIDSFITYRNVVSDLNRAKKKGIDAYRAELDEKVQILEYLIKNYNDGRKKNFYCIAVNLLNISGLKNIMDEINKKIGNQTISIKEKIQLVVDLFNRAAKKNGIELELRK